MPGFGHGLQRGLALIVGAIFVGKAIVPVIQKVVPGISTVLVIGSLAGTLVVAQKAKFWPHLYKLGVVLVLLFFLSEMGGIFGGTTVIGFLVLIAAAAFFFLS